MIASTALELLLIGLAVWQLIVVRRSIRADREREERRQPDSRQDTG
ncbi:hypothetical protein [Methylobacterium marchantiae]|uniref:Uncharacterized protein n=1 Tax=Methylobacterium marchantiae TaxID=600331 RepID=A0ABW3X1Q9_9HYPH|nr:hypothetical protein AIGOOFII_1749 [Methylobacterium marchantiae]